MDYVSLVLKLVSLISTMVTFLREKNLIDAGKSQAIAEALRGQADLIHKAKIVQDEADKIHKTDKTDKAFDTEFFR